MLAREHVHTENTLVQEQLSTQGTLPREHVSTQGTLVHEHINMTQDKLVREHVIETVFESK